jgi:hypothetical protein
MHKTAWSLLMTAVAFFTPLASAFIDSPHHPPEKYTLSWVRLNAWVAVLKVDRVDMDRGVVLYELAEQLQGKDWPRRLKHVIKLDGKIPPGLDKLKAGQSAVCFAWDRQFKLFVTFVEGSWYLSVADRDDSFWCRITSQRPDLNCLFVGSATELAEAFRELGAGRETIVLCQKSKKDPATQFMRCTPKKQERREPVPALDAVAAKLPADSASDPKETVPALVSALRHEDALVREAASRLLKKIDPEAAKKAAER